MTSEQIKIRVKAAYENVDSGEFLQMKVDEAVEKHKQNYRKYKAIHPDATFDSWKKLNKDININSNNNQEIMAMGIFFLALDEFKPDD